MTKTKTKTSIIFTMLLVAMLLRGAPVLAEDGEYGLFNYEQQESQSFGLYVDCQPVHVIVQESSVYAEKIGLTRELIMLTAEAHLRKAKIFSKEMKQPFFLGIEIDVFRQAFNINLFFGKQVKDSLFSKRDGVGFTWINGVIGMHDDEIPYILSVLSKLLDGFIVEYFRANQEACNLKP